MRSFAIQGFVNMLEKRNDFIAFFNALTSKQLPFVIFRLPQSEEIILYQQENNNHYTTASIEEKGFVFAPFKASSVYTFIPNQVEKRFALPQVIIKNTPINTQSLSKTKDYYHLLVEAAKETIKAKTLKKVVVSRIHEHKYSGSIAESILGLIDNYPNAMVYYWSHPNTGNWMGASPETLLESNDGKFKTMALAGTLVFKNNQRPSWSLKEVEEQKMVADFIYYQLKTIYPKSAITVSPTYTKRAGNLVHLCTDFEFPHESTRILDIVRLLHPTPAVAGIPVKDSLEFLNKHETHDRKYYAGFFGPIQKNNVRLFVNLRCAEIHKNNLDLYVGGGITALSDLETEWLESERKAETLLRVL